MKIPAISSKQFRKLLEQFGCYFARQGATDHAIFVRETSVKKFAAPVQTGKKDLSPIYIKLVLKQLGFTSEEIKNIFR